MSAVAVAGADLQEPVATSAWEKIGNAVALLLYSGVVLFTVRYHEKWSDEAQAWLIARDLDLKTIWFHELRYEGSPGLWHTILWVAQHWFHLPYAALGYIGVAFAIAGSAVLIYKSPFPWFLRWPLAFTYFLIYQYAVIARPYTLLALLCFVAAACFKDTEHPVRMTVVLVIMANLTVHGAIIAGCLGLGYLFEAIKRRRELKSSTRTQYVICVVVMALTFLFLFAILKPTPDVEVFARKQMMSQLGENSMMHQPGFWTKMESIASGAFLDYALPSYLFVLLAVGWSVLRRKWFTFVFPVALLMVFYASIHGWAHHHGTVTIAAITGLWIAWPTLEEQRAASQGQRWANRSMTALLAVFCAVNIWDAAVSIRNDYLYPYCGAEDAARYLRSVGAENKRIYGYLDGITGIEAYFDHNIILNFPTAYYHHGLPLPGVVFDLDQLQASHADYVVVWGTEDPQQTLTTFAPGLSRLGYKLAHFSDGYMIYKRAVYIRLDYFIFEKTETTAAAN